MAAEATPIPENLLQNIRDAREAASAVRTLIQTTQAALLAENSILSKQDIIDNINNMKDQIHYLTSRSESNIRQILHTGQM